jgi:hypothetical protein
MSAGLVAAAHPRRHERVVPCLDRVAVAAVGGVRLVM